MNSSRVTCLIAAATPQASAPTDPSDWRQFAPRTSSHREPRMSPSWPCGPAELQGRRQPRRARSSCKSQRRCSASQFTSAARTASPATSTRGRRPAAVSATVWARFEASRVATKSARSVAAGCHSSKPAAVTVTVRSAGSHDSNDGMSRSCNWMHFPACGRKRCTAIGSAARTWFISRSRRGIAAAPKDCTNDNIIVRL